jgi:hypothetical protein
VTDIQRIDCEVTFLARTRFGPINWPKILSGNGYRPHLVVGDPNQREAKIATRTYEVENPDGTRRIETANNFIDEEILAVAFEDGPPNPQIGESLRVTLVLMFWPHPAYEKLVPGATFTVREGVSVVGYGKVLKWHSPESS